jgi:hypothetical protein
MSLIRDNDDERRARVEALICELLNAQRHTSAQGEESGRPITFGEGRDRPSIGKREGHRAS